MATNGLGLFDLEDGDSRPFKLVDASREIKLGLTASSLIDLISRAKVKFHIELDQYIRIVLENDGTEIDDNDYFNTLEPDTTLMILVEEEKWTPYRSFLTLGLALEPREDEFENEGRQSGSNSTPASPVEELVWRLHQDLSFFPWLTPLELENIAKMDRDEMRKVVPDDKFLEFLQDLCERYLQDKDKDQGGVTNILHDPIKLIRMYSKYNHFIGGSYDLNLRRTN